MKKRKWITLLALLVIFILMGVYFYEENTVSKVTSYTLDCEKLPEEFDGFKIIQVSDLHNDKSKKLKKRLINSIEEISPDIIVITGDIIDSRKMDIDLAVEFVVAIKDIAPIYYVNGNHEARSGYYAPLKAKLKDLGVHVLDNEMELITRGSLSIQILGVKDPHEVNDFGVDDSLIIEEEIKTITYSKEEYTILLSHRPELFESYCNKNMDLVFTGHAHGGQIRIPFIGGVVAPNQGLFPKYDSGLYENESTKMIVSRGIGNSILPFRINNNPELVAVTLKAI